MAQKGYGEHAYEHAKPAFTGLPNENWTLSTEKVNKKRVEEYERRLEKFKRREGLQSINQLVNTDKTFTFEKGSALYPFLTKNGAEGYGMNKHTSFFVMVKMLKEGVNVDRWFEGDSITLKKDGSMVIVQSAEKGGAKRTVSIKDLLKPASTPTPAPTPAPTAPAPAPAPAPTPALTPAPTPPASPKQQGKSAPGESLPGGK